MAAVRLYAVAFINLSSVRMYQAQMPLERAHQWVTFWRLTGAESLCVTAAGFRTRIQLHLPLQLAALALAGWHLSAMCAQVRAAMRGTGRRCPGCQRPPGAAGAPAAAA